MPGMKITVDAAMRARDVSRPRAGQERLAEQVEPAPAGKHRNAANPSASGSGAAKSPASAPAAPAEPTGAAATPPESAPPPPANGPTAAGVTAAPTPAPGHRRRRRR